MASIYDNVLSNEELDYFNHPDVYANGLLVESCNIHF